MKSFLQLIKEISSLEYEEMLMEDSENEKNDDKGKLHELLLAKHLHPKKQLPSHHRSESENPDHAGTPTQVHDKLKKKMSEHEYNQIDHHAKQTAKAVMDHLKEKGHIPKDHVVHDIHWTSNRDTEKKAGDHEKTTGTKDVNSNADLIITHRHKSDKKAEHKHFIGVSAKYGSQKPNYKNPGLESLEKHAGHAPGHYTKIQKKHESNMAKSGYPGTQAARHKQYKEDKKVLDHEQSEHKEEHGSLDNYKPKHPQAKRAHAAEQSALDTRKKMAREHEKGLSKKNDKELRDHVADLVSPATVHHHIVAHSKTKTDGSADSHVSDSHDVAHEHLHKFENLHVKKGAGISATIHGKNKNTGKTGPVATIGFKGTSGPHKGTNGTVKLS
jgi:hypothetical protein